MKKLVFSFVFCLGAFYAFSQDFPSMKGYWYCQTSDELFVISTDPDQTVKGKGVLYSNGNGRFTMMQIMTQTRRDNPDGTVSYLIRVYDPAKPKKVFELISRRAGERIFLAVTQTGSRDAVYRFMNLKDWAQE